MKTIRVLVVDDHALVREGLRRVFDDVEDIHVVGEAGDAAEALTLIGDSTPDLVVLDITLPDGSGLDLIAEFKSRSPASRILVLSMHNNPAYVERAIAAGAHGYLIKTASPELLRNAVRLVADGGTLFEAKAMAPKGTALAELTPRERDILSAIADGLRNREIADRLSISPRTVESHRESLMRKLDIRTIAGLTRFAIAHGLTNEPPAGP
jgi:DNA-binding NarL/FixJ family response regulator